MPSDLDSTVALASKLVDMVIIESSLNLGLQIRVRGHNLN